MIEQQDLLAEDVYLEQASSGKRFLNYLIDVLVISNLFDRLFNYLLEILQLRLFDFAKYDNTTLVVLNFLVISVVQVFFMTFYEFFGKGVTLGKLITGTKAVNEDGSTITFKAALLRSLCRIIPFEPFSALGTPCYPWHDKLTKTYVIDTKNSRLSY